MHIVLFYFSRMIVIPEQMDYASTLLNFRSPFPFSFQNTTLIVPPGVGGMAALTI